MRILRNLKWLISLPHMPYGKNRQICTGFKFGWSSDFTKLFCAMVLLNPRFLTQQFFLWGGGLTMDATGSHEEDEKVTWPEFSDGFFVYVGIGLLLLTVVNNIAFRVIFGPIDKPVQKVSSAPRVRYRLRSQNEITSLDAPPLVNAP